MNRLSKGAARIQATATETAGHSCKRQQLQYKLVFDREAVKIQNQRVYRELAARSAAHAEEAKEAKSKSKDF